MTTLPPRQPLMFLFAYFPPRGTPKVEAATKAKLARLRTKMVKWSDQDAPIIYKRMDAGGL